jgi:hypothetical protein
MLANLPHIYVERYLRNGGKIEVIPPKYDDSNFVVTVKQRQPYAIHGVEDDTNLSESD